MHSSVLQRAREVRLGHQVSLSEAHSGSPIRTSLAMALCGLSRFGPRYARGSTCHIKKTEKRPRALAEAACRVSERRLAPNLYGLSGQQLPRVV